MNSLENYLWLHERLPPDENVCTAKTKSLVSQARLLRFLTPIGSALATLYGKDRQVLAAYIYAI